MPKKYSNLILWNIKLKGAWGGPADTRVERLDNQKAAEEAAMLQGYLEKLRSADFTPRPEDYDNASKIISDLKVAATNEPNEFKRTALIEQIMTKYVGYPLALAIAVLWLPDEIDRVKERTRTHIENWMGPSRRLEIMRKAGEKFLNKEG